MSTPITIQLSTPVAFEGYTITELADPQAEGARPPRHGTGQQQASRHSSIRARRMVALLSGIPEAAVEELDAADFTRASEVIAGFFEKAAPLATGGA